MFKPEMYNGIINQTTIEENFNEYLEVLSKERQSLTEKILSNIIREITRRVEMFSMEESKIERVSTDLFGYNKQKPDINKLKSDIENFLKSITKKDIINGFRLNLEKNGDLPYIDLTIYPFDGSKMYRGNINLGFFIDDRLYRH